MKPSDLARRPFFLTLGKVESEESVMAVVNALAVRGDTWRPIAFDEVQKAIDEGVGETWAFLRRGFTKRRHLERLLRTRWAEAHRLPEGDGLKLTHECLAELAPVAQRAPSET